MAPQEALDFPASYGIGFFTNHSMLGLRRSRWRTVTGGSRTYVEALLDRLGAPVHLGAPVRSLRRTDAGVALRDGNGTERSFDATVVATSAPRALALLEDPSDAEQEILSAFESTANETVLHTDGPSCRTGRPTAPRGTTARRVAASTPTDPRSRTRSTACNDWTRGGVLRDAQPHRDIDRDA